MAKKICFIPLFLFLCIALFLCQGLGLDNDKDDVDNYDPMSFLNTNVQAEYNKMSSKQADWWWYRGRPHFPRWPRPHAHPPLPAGPSPRGFPKIHWPFAHTPLPHGFPKIHWPFVHPPRPHGFPKIHWPFVHPPLPHGFPKIHWPFVHPPIPSGGSKSPPHFPRRPWFHHCPWLPPYWRHPHGATENVDINNEGAGGVLEDFSAISTNPKCSLTSKIVESCMQASSISHCWGYTFSEDCCKAIVEVSDECHPTAVSMIKDQCSNNAIAPPPTA